MEPQRQSRTVDYLASNLSSFVKEGETVLICFPGQPEGSLGNLYEQAAKRCGGKVVHWGPDCRWKTLLQQAFFSRASVIIGPPLAVLGLSKLKTYQGVPLSIRKVVTAGYPCLDWMIDGIIKGLDVQTWGSFGLDTTSVVAGFSCGKSRGVHLRHAEYGMDIVDDSGRPLPPGEKGEMVLYPREAPELRYSMQETGRIDTSLCRCGSSTPRLMDMHPGKAYESDLVELGQYLHSWTSVLDCAICKGPCGLELELVVFPGEKLPTLPSAAKRVVRAYNPKNDEPMWYSSLNQRKFFQSP